MTSLTSPTNLPAPTPRLHNPRTALLQFAGLLALSLLVLRSEWLNVIHHVARESEFAHAIAVPVLIALLIWRRRRLLVEAVRPGSMWGLMAIGVGLLMYAASSWPFNYGYPRQMAMVPLLAGCILSAAGWRVLKRCVPMLLLLAIAIPLGMRHFASLVIRPETATLAVAEKILDALPGVMITLDGPDLHFTYDQSAGVIALGDPFRGASLLLASLTIVVFITFVSIRPMWQVIAAAVLAGPIVLFCNLLRVLMHGVVTIYGETTPLDSMPRVTAYIFSLVMAYGCAVLLFAVLNRIIVTPDVTAPSDAVPV